MVLCEKRPVVVLAKDRIPSGKKGRGLGLGAGSGRGLGVTGAESFLLESFLLAETLVSVYVASREIRFSFL